MFRILFLALLLIFPLTALAHSPLDSSFPKDGEKLDKAPPEIIMVFKSPAKLIKINLEKSSDEQRKSLLGGLFGTDDGESVLLGTSFLLKFKERHVISVPYLETGDYKVFWRALAEDGHVIKGEFSFTVAGI